MIREGNSIETIIASLTRGAAPLLALFFVALALLLTVLVPACRNWTGFGFDPRGPEMQRIREVLRLEEGMTIADIGAGKGQLSSALASAVGSDGRIFATDVDRARVEALGDRFRREKLTNVVVVEGGTSDTRLPRACCDAIVLRRVYHHLTDTAAINASVFRSLRPDGVLAVIDFAPPAVLGRGEFGVPATAVIGEVTRSGFELLRQIDDWPGRGPLGSYCVLFRKPL
jgi:ubiquinone/menaquinone biosynthesis C-methylase UbiE